MVKEGRKKEEEVPSDPLLKGIHNTDRQGDTRGDDVAEWRTSNIHCSETISNAPGLLSLLDNQSNRQDNTTESRGVGNQREGKTGSYRGKMTHILCCGGRCARRCRKG